MATDVAEGGQAEFSAEELEIIASTPSKPKFVETSAPVARSFLDRMQSSVADPVRGKVKSPEPVAESQDEAFTIFRA